MTGQKESSEQVSGGFNVSAFGTHGTVPRETELDWFFSTGQSLFEASTFGALLERQSQYGQTFETCSTCSGSGFDADDNSCPKCRGMGGTPEPNSERKLQDGLLVSTSRCLLCARPPRRLWRCKKCRGDGRVAGAPCVACQGLKVPVRKNGKPRPRPALRPRGICLSCNDTLVHERHPVGLKSETSPEPSYTPDDVALQRFAQVSRYLRQCSSGTVEALAAFFGLSGYRWANTKWGRLFAVVPLTEEWEAMLVVLPNKQGLGDHQLLENYVKDVERNQGKDQQKQAQERLETVTRQAVAVFKAAALEWRSVVEPGRRPEPTIQEQAVAA